MGLPKSFLVLREKKKINLSPNLLLKALFECLEKHTYDKAKTSKR